METTITFTKKDKRKAMWKYSCSGALYSLLNQQFGNEMETEVRASSSLSGGMMQLGQQCGMVWGSSMAAGAESLRRCKNPDQATELAISTSRGLMESYRDRTKCNTCREFTKSDFSRPAQMVSYMVFRARACFKLLHDWVPEAVESAREGLSEVPERAQSRTLSCASEVARRMGASDPEAIMVAGFAGGVGLSGNCCGALAAAVWMKSLHFLKTSEKKNTFLNADAKKTLEAFRQKTGEEFQCHKICGRKFNSSAEHTDFIEKGGCADLMETLAKS